MNNLCNSLTSDAQSSVVDFINLAEANPYQRKIYQNRYWFALDAIQRLPGHPVGILDAATGGEATWGDRLWAAEPGYDGFDANWK